jgi:alpha-ketoglutaric semialdehyde dehydrogenase
MKLHGKSMLAGEPVDHLHGHTFRAFDPSEGHEIEPTFYEAELETIVQAATLAAEAFQLYRCQKPEAVAAFLDAIATEIEALDHELIERANSETGLTVGRLTGERARTTGQLRLFAELVREGSWVEATIDRPQPERKPQPRPDLRRMLIPLGPVAVFGASNFPLAFSVAGGDTAAALAAGNPVIVKGHPSHPGTSEMVALAIVRATRSTGIPDGVFALLQGSTNEISLRLVEHPEIKAVGFTGSQRAGKAIFDACARRPEPIPVYAEMGSVNPIFILPEALRERGDSIADGLLQSVTLGTGQFCTKPGLVIGILNKLGDPFIERINRLIMETHPGTMLDARILHSYEEEVRRRQDLSGLQLAQTTNLPDPAQTQAAAFVFSTDAEFYLNDGKLGEEIFGPSTLIVRCNEEGELKRVAESLQGHLTATIHATAEDLRQFSWLVSLLENKVGRLLYNGFPTGVEVCPSMHHGGPYPATTDARSTSVGTYAIKRFARPICYQDFPETALPLELQNKNPRCIWRLVDGEWTKAPC